MVEFSSRVSTLQYVDRSRVRVTTSVDEEASSADVWAVHRALDVPDVRARLRPHNDETDGHRRKRQRERDRRADQPNDARSGGDNGKQQRRTHETRTACGQGQPEPAVRRVVFETLLQRSEGGGVVRGDTCYRGGRSTNGLALVRSSFADRRRRRGPAQFFFARTVLPRRTMSSQWGHARG